jgi:hypothetical protein
MTLLIDSLMYRFLALTVSFIITIMVYSLRIPSIQATIPYYKNIALADEDYEAKDATFYGMWVASLAGHIIEFIGMLSGVSLTKIGNYCYSITSHSVGSLLLLCAMADAWDYRVMIWCFVLFSILPAMAEFFYIVKFVFHDYDLMSHLDVRV